MGLKLKAINTMDIFYGMLKNYVENKPENGRVGEEEVVVILGRAVGALTETVTLEVKI